MLAAVTPYFCRGMIALTELFDARLTLSLSSLTPIPGSANGTVPGNIPNVTRVVTSSLRGGVLPLFTAASGEDADLTRGFNTSSSLNSSSLVGLDGSIEIGLAGDELLSDCSIFGSIDFSRNQRTRRHERSRE